jgi:hypothetical protein
MPTPPTVISLDEIEHLSGPGSLTWLPVRHTLGIRAFGCNAYVAGASGEDVVEPHDETADPGEDPELAHEELYFVARGHATFTIDGTEHDAPTGTYVFIPDPHSHRHAVALQAGTTVLSFGGPPTFSPSAWEWSFRAAPLIGEPETRARAREILDDGLTRYPDHASLHYNLACLEAVEGNAGPALERLRRAIALRPACAAWARDDDDLVSLRDDPRFTQLLDGGD